MSSALGSKNMAKPKTKILLETVNDIVTEWPNINDLMQRKIIDEVTFLVSLEAKHFS